MLCGWMEGRIRGREDGCKEGKIVRMDGWKKMDEWKEGEMDGWKKRGCEDGWKERWMDEWRDGMKDGQINGWKEGKRM